jgi:hypothetical protein
MIKQIFKADRDHANRYKWAKSVQFYFYQFKKNHAPPQLFLKKTQNRGNSIRKYKGDPKGIGKLVAA